MERYTVIAKVFGTLWIFLCKICQKIFISSKGIEYWYYRIICSLIQVKYDICSKTLMYKWHSNLGKTVDPLIFGWYAAGNNIGFYKLWAMSLGGLSVKSIWLLWCNLDIVFLFAMKPMHLMSFGTPLYMSSIL